MGYNARMHLLDLTLESAEANLALDEVLLERCEQDPSAECLRFWQPTEYFIVLGYSNKVSSHVALEACRRARVPVLRRPSGGGTVLQGPGCLNYSLVLRTDVRPQLGSIVSANGSILQRQRRALEDATGLDVRIEGVTDLAVDGRKVCGNAQRRRLRSLLFHGSILAGLDPGKVQAFLAEPPLQPEYRRERRHVDFLRNLETPAEVLKRRIALAWEAREPGPTPDAEAVRRLVESRYSREDWNFRF